MDKGRREKRERGIRGSERWRSGEGEEESEPTLNDVLPLTRLDLLKVP